MAASAHPLLIKYLFLPIYLMNYDNENIIFLIICHYFFHFMVSRKFLALGDLKMISETSKYFLSKYFKNGTISADTN